MHSSKLLDIIQLLNRKELLSFQQYLSSDYFNHGTEKQDLLQLFLLIRNHFDDLKHPALQKKAVFEVLYPRKAFNSGKLDKLMSALLHALTIFLGQQHYGLEKSIIPQQLAFVNLLQNRKSANHARYYFKKLNKTIEQLELNDGEYYFNKYLIEKERFRQIGLEEKSLQKQDHSKTYQSLDIFYLITRLEHACYLLSEHKFRKPLKLEGLTTFLDNIKADFVKTGSFENPLVDVYYRIYEMLKSDREEPEYFNQIQRLMDREFDNIPFSTFKTLSAILRNYKIAHYNKSSQTSTQELFDLYKKHLEQGLVNYSSGIHPTTYKNVVTMGLRAEAYDWVNNFIHQFKDKIEGKPPESDFYQFNLAKYKFAIKEYDQALDLISQSFGEIYLKIAAKILELKILFETDSQILSSRIDAFKLFIHRLSPSEVIASKKKSSQAFVNILRQLANQNTQMDQKKLKRIQSKVTQNEMISARDWLLSTLDRLIKK